jgi:hypothetical protein
MAQVLRVIDDPLIDKVQYDSWVEGFNWSPEKIAWENEIVEELQANPTSPSRGFGFGKAAGIAGDAG